LPAETEKVFNDTPELIREEIRRRKGFILGIERGFGVGSSRTQAALYGEDARVHK